MRNDSASEHIGARVSEYVLGLMSIEERRDAAKHVTGCLECRQMVAAEEDIGRLVRSTIQATTTNQVRLQELMPKAPRKKSGLLTFESFQQQLAVAALVIVVLFSGIGLLLQQGSSNNLASTSTAFIATAPSSQTPTASTLSPTPWMTSNKTNQSQESETLRTVPVITPAPAFLETVPGKN